MDKKQNRSKTSIKDINPNANKLAKVVELSESELLLVTGGLGPEGGTTSGGGGGDCDE